jgi:hypothetical protein
MTGSSLRSRCLVPLAAALVSLIVLGLAPSAGAAEVGFFTPTGPMSGGGPGAVAVPLPGGRVLVAGGEFDGSPDSTASRSSAEVFDPSTNSFSSAGIGSMSIPRTDAAAAPLPDGRVLVAGGYDEEGGFQKTFQYLSSAEVFDPATNSFSSAGIGSMSVPRAGAVAAPLPDGRVLIAGGFYCDGLYCSQSHSLSSAEVFDPSTNSFSSAGIGSMTVPRWGAAAAPLPDGRVLVAGGRYDESHPLSSAEIFDPSTNTFSSAGIGSMSVPRPEAAAASLADGRVLIVGGYFGQGQGGSVAEIFNPSTNTFSSAGMGSPSFQRAGPAAASLPGGRVLVAGGVLTNTAEIFQLATNSFSFTLQGRQLIVSVEAPGKVSVVDAPSPLRASASKKRKRIRMLNASSGSGNPPTITVPLALTKPAKRSLKRKGKLTIRARITFTAPGGLLNTQTAKLKIKRKK